MENIDSNELWRKIPVEEKLDLVAAAHGQGILTFFSIIWLSAAFAIALQLPWVFWGSFLFAPFGFQFAAGRRYKRSKPAIMLSYLAARSVARRFAYSLNHDDLTLRLLFRGYAYRSISAQENLEGANDPDAHRRFPVWIALFGGSMVVLAEGDQGARPVFMGCLTEKLDIETVNGAPGDYSRNKELVLSYEDRKVGVQKIAIGSRQAAALIAFERVSRDTVQKAVSATVESD
jgi:hypothetical protein